MPLTSTYAVRGAFPGRRRPLCVRGHRAWVHGRGRKNPRTGPVGAVTPTVRPASVPLTWHFRMPARCRRLPRRRGLGLGVLGAEGVGDALVGGIGLPVDAVGVDLQQDRDAVPGPAGDLGRGHPGVQPQRHRRVPQVVGAPAERRPVLGGGEGLLAGLGPDLVVGRVLEDPAPGGLEDPPVRGRAVPPDVGAQQPRPVRAGWGRYGSRGRRGASGRVPASRCRGRSRPCRRGRQRRPGRSFPIPSSAGAGRLSRNITATGQAQAA